MFSKQPLCCRAFLKKRVLSRIFLGQVEGRSIKHSSTQTNPHSTPTVWLARTTNNVLKTPRIVPSQTQAARNTVLPLIGAVFILKSRTSCRASTSDRRLAVRLGYSVSLRHCLMERVLHVETLVTQNSGTFPLTKLRCRRATRIEDTVNPKKTFMLSLC